MVPEDLARTRARDQSPGVRGPWQDTGLGGWGRQSGTLPVLRGLARWLDFMASAGRTQPTQHP